jgi:hypothetical protein
MSQPIKKDSEVIKIYILQHTITKEILAVFDNKELAETWKNVVNYSMIIEMDIKQ